MTNQDKVRRYALLVQYIEHQGFVACFKELGLSATGHGETREEAIADLNEAISALMEVAVEPWPGACRQTVVRDNQTMNENEASAVIGLIQETLDESAAKELKEWEEQLSETQVPAWAKGEGWRYKEWVCALHKSGVGIEKGDEVIP